MRSRRILIGSDLAVVVLVAAAAAWAYDHSKRETIANGVRVAGVDVGGMDVDEARLALRRQLLNDPGSRSSRRQWQTRGVVRKARRRGGQRRGGGRRGARARPRRVNLRPRRARGHGRQRRRRRPAARRSTAPRGRALRRRGRRPLRPRPARREHRLLADVARARRRAGRRDGPAAAAARAVMEALTHAEARHAIAVRTHTVKPKVTTASSRRSTRSSSPSIAGTSGCACTRTSSWRRRTRSPSGRRGSRRRPASTHPGQADRTLLARAEQRVGRRPRRPGDPAGPHNPIKARWMGIYAGAGIHGTTDVGSLGSAASHGCIRMAIPDVIDLYDRTPIGATVYIA